MAPESTSSRKTPRFSSKGRGKSWVVALSLMLTGMQATPLPSTRSTYDRFTGLDSNATQTVLESLNAQEREQLARQRDRFYRLSEQEQNRYRQLHRELLEHEDAERLTRILINYNTWLDSLTTAERARLADLPPAERLSRVREMKQQQDVRMFGRLVDEALADTDFEAITQWMEEIVLRNEQQVIALVESREPRFDREHLPERDRDRARALLFMIRHVETEVLAQWTSPADFVQLAERLSPEARRPLQQEAGEIDQWNRVRRWLAASIWARMGRMIDRDDLERFFNEELSAEQKQRLDQLSPEDRLNTLRDLYLRRRMRRNNRDNHRSNGASRGEQGERGPRPRP